MKKDKNIYMLGGGLAGLAVGYMAQQQGVSLHLLEASNGLGGTSVTYSRTIQHQTFLYDSGAHRFHDKSNENTLLLNELLENQLLNTTAPSQIFINNTFLDFPLKPVNVLKYLGTFKFFRAGMDVMTQRFKNRKKVFHNFETFAYYKYGKRISHLFLTDYSEKLWGKPVKELSTDIAGIRLKGLTLTHFILQGLFNIKSDKKHSETGFYYPKYGYGSIAAALSNQIGQENIELNQRVTKIKTQNNRVTAIEINGKEERKIDKLISTLPLDVLLKILEPQPQFETDEGEHISLPTLTFRHIRLVAIFLDIEKVSDNASIYFPEKKYPFTRIFEPKNRSEAMSPKGRTSLIVEIPTSENDEWWLKEERELIKVIVAQLAQIGLLNINDMLGAESRRIKNAYPVLEKDYAQNRERVYEYLSKFENLHLAGRSGKFQYTYFHDILSEARMLFDVSEEENSHKMNDNMAEK